MKNRLRNWLLTEGENTPAEDIEYFSENKAPIQSFEEAKASLNRLQHLVSGDESQRINVLCQHLVEQTQPLLSLTITYGDLVEITGDFRIAEAVIDMTKIRDYFSPHLGKLSASDLQQTNMYINMLKQFLWERQAIRQILNFTPEHTVQRRQRR